MRIAVVSSLYGGYDTPAVHAPQDLAAEWVLVTDRIYNAQGWREVVEPRPSVHPRLAAKVAKCRPDFYADADIYIWIDASFQISSRDFLSWCVTSLGGNLMAQIPHPERRSIKDEADVSAMMAKYQGLPVHAQVESYIKNGYNDGWGLWATGLRVQRDDPLMWSIGDHWLREQMRWTYQDQLSQPYVLWSNGLRPVDLDGALWGNPRFSIRGHASNL